MIIFQRGRGRVGGGEGGCIIWILLWVFRKKKIFAIQPCYLPIPLKSPSHPRIHRIFDDFVAKYEILFILAYAFRFVFLVSLSSLYSSSASASLFFVCYCWTSLVTAIIILRDHLKLYNRHWYHWKTWIKISLGFVSIFRIAIETSRRYGSDPCRGCADRNQCSWGPC